MLLVVVKVGGGEFGGRQWRTESSRRQCGFVKIAAPTRGQRYILGDNEDSKGASEMGLTFPSRSGRGSGPGPGPGGSRAHF